MIRPPDSLPHIKIVQNDKAFIRFYFYTRECFILENEVFDLLFMEVKTQKIDPIKQLLFMQNVFATISDYKNAGIHYHGGIYICHSCEKKTSQKDFIKILHLQYAYACELERANNMSLENSGNSTSKQIQQNYIDKLA